MNINSAKCSFVGGLLDGARLVVLSTTNQAIFYDYRSGRKVVYVLCDGKYYFKCYDTSCKARTE